MQEFVHKRDINQMPTGLRGVYVLYKYRRRQQAYDVVYVGMTRSSSGRGGIKSRLRSHKRSKGDMWSHFSVFEVWDNIRDDEIVELEGLFRQIYRYDQRANRLNIQRSFKKLKRIPKIISEQES